MTKCGSPSEFIPHLLRGGGGLDTLSIMLHLKKLLFFALGLPLFLPKLALAATFLDGIKKSASDVANGALDIDTGTVKQPEEVVLGVVTVMLGFLGVIFFILMIYGGSLWMEARGNEETTAKAKKIITDAVIGLLVIAAAYMVTYWVGAVIFEQTGLVNQGSITNSLNP